MVAANPRHFKPKYPPGGIFWGTNRKWQKKVQFKNDGSDINFGEGYYNTNLYLNMDPLTLYTQIAQDKSMSLSRPCSPIEEKYIGKFQPLIKQAQSAGYEFVASYITLNQNRDGGYYVNLDFKFLDSNHPKNTDKGKPYECFVLNIHVHKKSGSVNNLILPVQEELKSFLNSLITKTAFKEFDAILKIQRKDTRESFSLRKNDTSKNFYSTSSSSSTGSQPSSSSSFSSTIPQTSANQCTFLPPTTQPISTQKPDISEDHRSESSDPGFGKKEEVRKSPSPP